MEAAGNAHEADGETGDNQSTYTGWFLMDFSKIPISK